MNEIKISGFVNKNKDIFTFKTQAQTENTGECNEPNQPSSEGSEQNQQSGNSDPVTENYSHTEGYETIASGETSHAEGYQTTASNTASHAEGHNTTASGNSSHAEGLWTKASGYVSHAEGYNTNASSDYTHAEGYQTIASGQASHSEGYSSMEVEKCRIIPLSLDLSQKYGINFTHYSPDRAEADPDDPDIPEVYYGPLYSDSNATNQVGTITFCQFFRNVDGINLDADLLVLESSENITEGEYYIRKCLKANGISSHAEGFNTTALRDSAHAEGNYTAALNDNGAHAEGNCTVASGRASHAEGDHTSAIGRQSHAEGQCTIAAKKFSHAEGEGTIAMYGHQHVQGAFNIPDPNGDYAFIIGNGDDNQNRSNAFAIKWDGTIVVWNNGTPVSLTPTNLTALINGLQQ